MDYQREVQCLEGEQVSLVVKTTGRPTPTVTWLFNGRKVEDDYSTELGKDGSLVLMSVEMKHAGTYTFTVSNRVGSVEGCTKLVVHWFIYSVPSQSHAVTHPGPVYVFIHDAVLESLTSGKKTQILASGLSGAIKKLEGKDRVIARTEDTVPCIHIFMFCALKVHLLVSWLSASFE